MTYILRPRPEDGIKIHLTKSSIQLQLQNQQDTVILELQGDLVDIFLERLGHELRRDVLQGVIPF